MSYVEVVVDGVVFDSDGVLVDSETSVLRSWRQVAAEYGLDAERLVRELAGVRAVDTLGRYLSGDRLDDAVRRLETLEVETSDDVTALPGALELLSALPRGRWAVATSATRRLAEVRWAAAGLRFDAPTVTADDVERGKPHPDPFLRAAASIGVAPSRCLVFEDSPSGGRAALAAGSTVVAVGSAEWEFVPGGRVDDLRSVTVDASSGRLVVRIG